MKRPESCRGCPFDDGGVKDEFVPFEPETGQKLLAIGEGPGKDECVAEKPFIGRSGKMLDTAFKFTPMSRQQARVGNITLCLPPATANQSKWVAARQHCWRAHVAAEISKSQARAILLIGGQAASLTGYDSIETIRGSVYKTRGGAPFPSGSVMIPTLHPAGIMRGNLHLKPVFVSDVERAVCWALNRETGYIPKMEDFNLNSQEPVKFDPKAEVVFDVETDRDGRPTMIGTLTLGGGVVTNGPAVLTNMDGEGLRIGHNMAFDVKALGGEDAVPGKWADTIIAAALVQPALPRSLKDCASLHGGDFYWYWKDLVYNPVTQQVATDWLDLPPDFSDWEHLYNALDVWWTAVVWRALNIEMGKMGLQKLFWNIQMPLLRECLRLEANGMPVDVAKMKRKRVEARKEIRKIRREVIKRVEQRNEARKLAVQKVHASQVAEAEANIEAAGQACAAHPEFDGRTRRTKCGDCKAFWEAKRPAKKVRAARVAKARAVDASIERFDPDSDLHWRWLIYEPKEVGGLGLSSGMRTSKKSSPSLNKDALRGLMALAKLDEEAKFFLQSRYRSGQLRSRISKYLKLPVDADGWTHPAYALHKTLNGRLASGLDDTDEDKPNTPYAVNAQNFPEDCRDIIVAPEGFKLVNADFASIEAWMVALDTWKLTGRREYFDMLMTVKDIHQLTADVISRRLAQPVTRKQGKTARHGWSYGMGAKKLAMTRAGEGITFEIAREAIAALNDMHPDVVEWRKLRLAQVSLNPTMRMPYDRICHFTVGRQRDGSIGPDDPNEVISVWPSGTANDIAKEKWLDMRNSGLLDRAKMGNHSHDSFLFVVRNEIVYEFAGDLDKLMRAPVERLRMWNPDGGPWSPRVSITVGQNWREASDDNPDGLKPWVVS